MKDWVLENINRFKELENQEIAAWRGFELTLRERGPDGFPILNAVDAVQEFLCLELTLVTGASLRMRANSEHGFGLCMTLVPDAESPAAEEHPAVALPTSVIERVFITLDEQQHLKRVVLKFVGGAVELVAGELVVAHQDQRVLLGSEEAILVRDLTATTD